MPLTTFDTTFDFTFARAEVSTGTPLPDGGGDGGGGIPGAVLPFATDRARLASCLHPEGQYWERWIGVPQARPDQMLPFIVAVPMPSGGIAGTPWCVEGGNFVDADTGADRGGWGYALTRVTDGNTLYIIHPGGPLETIDGDPVILAPGVYRILYGDAISEPFEVKKCSPCDQFRIRLASPTRIGELLYGTADFAQVFYVTGELTGPTYDESETKSGDTKSAATIKKVWTLRLENMTEPVIDALSLVGIHQLVEVSTLKADGTVNRPIRALDYQAKARITQSDSGGFDVELTLPVLATNWSTASGTASGCAVGEGGSALTVLTC